MKPSLLVTSFRVSREDRLLLGGQDIFVRQLVRGLAGSGFDVTLLTVQGLSDGSRSDEHGITTIYLPVSGSSEYEAADMNELGPTAASQIIDEYGTAVAGWIGDTYRSSRRPVALINNDLIEASFLTAARSIGIPIVTLVHYLFTELSFLALLRGQAEWLRREQNLNWRLGSLIAFFSRSGLSVHHLAACRRFMVRTGLSRFVPAWARRHYERERQVFELSDRIIVPSRGVHDKIIDYFRIQAPERLQITHYPVELAGCAPDAAARLRQTYGFADTDVVFLYMGRISPEKGTDLLIAAFLEAERRQPEWARRVALVLCGRASRAVDPGFSERVDELVGRLVHVRVARPGFVAGAEKTAHYQMADFVVVPSVYEAYGLSIAEGLALGKPVIASDTDGPRDLVKSEFGILVAYRDPNTRVRNLAAAILGVTDRDRAQMSAAAARAGTEHSWNHWLDEFESLLRVLGNNTVAQHDPTLDSVE